MRSARNAEHYWVLQRLHLQEATDGTFELKPAALNLRHEAHKISEMSNPQQYHSLGHSSSWCEVVRRCAIALGQVAILRLT